MAAIPGAEWKSAGLLAIVVWAVALGLFRHTAWLIASTWASSRTYSHGFLIIPIFLYLVWIRRERVMALRPKTSYWMLPVLAALLGIWLVGSLGEARVVEEFALVAILEMLLWIELGTAVVRAMWFPLLFLFFAVPFGEAAVGPLQDFTAHFAVGCLRLSRVPVILENRIIWVPSGPWLVAEACSGIRYLISSLVLGLVYASLVYRSKMRRGLFILASIVVPIVANGFRAYGIILLAYLSNNRLAVGVDHIIYGWVFFTAVQLLLFGVGLRWREVGPADRAEPHVRAEQRARIGSSPRAIITAAACALVVAGLAPLAEAYLWKRATIDSLQPTMRVSAPWQAVETYGQNWAPRLHPSSEFRGSYNSGGTPVDVYLARYSGRDGVELVSGYNQIADPGIWTEVAGGFRRVTINGRGETIRWDVLQSAASSRLVWRWYWTGAKPTSDAVKVKLEQAKARLRGQPLSIAVVAVSAEFLQNSSQAANELQEFLDHSSITLAPGPAAVTSSSRQ